MNIKILQHNEFSLFAVYVLEDFLSEQENLLVTEEVKKCIQEDNLLTNKTNVHAEMTSWQSALKRENLEFFFKKVADMVMIIYKMREPNPNRAQELTFFDSWAMKHNKNDYTRNHIHGSTMFSGSYNCLVPSSDQFMFFPDFTDNVQMKSNQLIFFHGLAKHSVNKNSSHNPRYSLAFNMEIDS
jgi:hypothetical protein|tara:strand:+ start:5344 stop:5895 length:552 start_codon:yes stop_codon:yes gene_type:complete